jgi:hypothetical protein
MPKPLPTLLNFLANIGHIMGKQELKTSTEILASQIIDRSRLGIN